VGNTYASFIALAINHKTNTVLQNILPCQFEKYSIWLSSLRKMDNSEIMAGSYGLWAEKLMDSACCTG
jgi:hypothetical protein